MAVGTDEMMFQGMDRTSIKSNAACRVLLVRAVIHRPLLTLYGAEIAMKR
jgi:hypothetical protein